MTIDEWLRTAEGRLLEAGIEEARLEARVLLEYALGADRAYVVSHGEALVPLSALEPLVERRLRREPLAYITGWREFYGRRFRVTPAVLIPRQETETLVEAALTLGASSVLDIGAGSGCIGITLALERPSASVTLCDVSSSALAVAKANAEELGASAKFMLSDVFAALDEERFDLIVSNPPYVSQGTLLMPEVGLYEPETALYSGETGFEFYERLAQESARQLTEGGTLLLESGDGQAADIIELFEAENWQRIGTWHDLLGIERVVGFTPLSSKEAGE